MMQLHSAQALRELNEYLEHNSPPARLALAAANKRVATILAKDRLHRRVLGGTVFDTVYEAVLAATKEIAAAKVDFSSRSSQGNLDCKTDSSGICTHKCPEGVWELVKHEQPWGSLLEAPVSVVTHEDDSLPDSRSPSLPVATDV